MYHVFMYSCIQLSVIRAELPKINAMIIMMRTTTTTTRMMTVHNTVTKKQFC